MLKSVETRGDFLSPKQAAYVLGLHVQSIYRAVERGDLECVRLTRRGAIRIPRSAVCPVGLRAHVGPSSDRPGVRAEAEEEARR